MSNASGHWLISTQVDPDTKVALAGVRPATKDDALHLLDQAYADAGTRGSNVFKKEYLHNGLWRVVLHKDRWLKPADPRRAAAVVAHYKEWLPPWRVPAPAASSSQPTRKRSRS